MIRLFRVFVPVGIFTLLVSEVLLVTSAFVLAGYLVLAVDPSVYLLYDGGLTRIFLVVLSILIALHFQDLYSRVHVKSRVVLAQQLCLVIGVAFLFQSLISYVNPELRVPIHLMLWGSVFTVIGVFTLRVLFSAYALSVVGGDRLLMVGGSPLLDDIARHIEEHPETGLVVAGYVDDNHDSDALRPGRKILGPLAALTAIVRVTRPDRIVVGMSERRNRIPVNELLELRLAGNIIEEVGAVYERVCGRVCIRELRPSQLIYSGELGPRPQNVMYQNVWNAALATVGIVLSAPVMLLAAVAVRLSSPGPVLYRQVRVGLRGVPFTVYKFRSMRTDAEAATGAVWAARDDPRVTLVGRWIRKLRFDELPQLFNVLKGQMSIVGPRPERPEFVKQLSEQIPFYGQRCCVRPGITGWAQINHKYGDTLEDTIKKLEYDLYYIKNMSLALDTYIIFHTAKTMLLSRGAQ
jgi:sugar transferase (PEP-CTERM system associated)